MIQGLANCSVCFKEKVAPQLPEKLKDHWAGSTVSPGVGSSSILMTMICTRFTST